MAKRKDDKLRKQPKKKGKKSLAVDTSVRGLVTRSTVAEAGKRKN